MELDLQKASMWKRIAAWIFDEILIITIAVGLGFLLSLLLGYNQYSERLKQTIEKYDAQYGVELEITENEYLAMTAEQQQAYMEAYDALGSDPEAVYARDMVVQLSLLMTTLGLLFATLIWEFFIPIFLKNGQTLGKKAFGLCLMRSDMVKINNLQLFTRALLGKFVIETMIPVYIGMMMLWGAIGVVGPMILAVIGIGQLACLCVTRTNSAIHDLMAGTVVVDVSQRIFPSSEALLEFQKQVAAERAARQTY